MTGRLGCDRCDGATPRRARLATGGIAYEVLKLPEDGKSFDFLSQSPLERPKDWLKFVIEADRESEFEDLRPSAQRVRPFGSEDWVIKTAKQLGLESTTNPRGRPKRFRKDPFCRSRSHPRRNSGPLPTKTTRFIQSCIDNIHPPCLSSIPMCSSESAEEGIADTQFAVQFNGLPSKLAGMSKPKYRKIVGAISTMRPLVFCPRSTPWPYMMANPWGL